MPQSEATVRATAEQIRDLRATVTNRGRWGASDQRGTLNLLDAARVQQAASLVREGITVSLARDLPFQPDPDNATPLDYRMLGTDAPGPPTDTRDYLGIACHGSGITHIDALCHMLIDGEMYNGFPYKDITDAGALTNSMSGCAGGVVGRGVLLDLPLIRGVEYLDPGTAVRPDELTAAAVALQVDVRPGDILLVYHGREQRRSDMPDWDVPSEGMAGLHPDCLRWIRKHDISVLGGDGIQDPLPRNATPGWPHPIHQCGIVEMGLWLIDNMSLRELSRVCRKLRRFECMFTAQPLRAHGATGLAVNPLAIL